MGEIVKRMGIWNCMWSNVVCCNDLIGDNGAWHIAFSDS